MQTTPSRSPAQHPRLGLLGRTSQDLAVTQTHRCEVDSRDFQCYCTVGFSVARAVAEPGWVYHVTRSVSLGHPILTIDLHVFSRLSTRKYGMGHFNPNVVIVFLAKRRRRPCL